MGVRLRKQYDLPIVDVVHQRPAEGLQGRLSQTPTLLY
jgi:hypothetical protein